MQAVRVAPPPPRAAGSAEDDLRPVPKLPWRLPDAAVLPARPARAQPSPRLRALAGGLSVALHLAVVGVLLFASAQALRAVPRPPEPPTVHVVFATTPRPAPSAAAEPPTEQPAPAQPPPVAQPPLAQRPVAPAPPEPPPVQPEPAPAAAASPPLPTPLPVPAPKPAAVPPPPTAALASEQKLPPVVPAPKLPAPKSARHRPPRPAPHHRAVVERAAPSRQPAAPAAAEAAPIVPPSLPGGMAERCPPVYPRAALRDRIQGRVVMRVHVAADGRPLAVSVVIGSGSALLDHAARAAVDACRFVPATQGGRPVAFDYEVPYRFRIEN